MNKQDLKSLLENIYHLLEEDDQQPAVSEPEMIPNLYYRSLEDWLGRQYYKPPPIFGGQVITSDQEQEMLRIWDLTTGGKPFPAREGTPPFGPFHVANDNYGTGGVYYQDANGDWYFWQNGGWVRQQVHTDSPPLPDWWDPAW